MPTEVIMPKVDMDMTHGTFAVWHVAEGASVRQGDPLFDIETEKAAMEVEAPAAGRLHNIQAKPGDRIEVGKPVAWIYADGETVGSVPQDLAVVSQDAPKPTRVLETVSAAATSVVPSERPAIAAVPSERPAIPAAPSERWDALSLRRDERLRATPLARSLARANGLTIAEIQGTGPRGRVQKEDVAQALLRRQPGPAILPNPGWKPQPGPLALSRRAGVDTPLFLLHGFTADSKSWAPFEKFLTGGRALLRLDLPGHGRSPARTIENFAALARMVVESFDDAVADTGPVHLVAHSLGAALSLAVADIRPRQIRSLTLIAPAGLGPEINADVLSGIVRAGHVDSLLPWLKALTGDPETIGPDYARAAFASRADATLRAAQADMAAALFRDGVQTFDLRPALARLQMPVQIVWGKQDPVVPLRQALSARGDFGLHLLEGTGHIPQYEQAEKLARIVARFVAGVEATTT
jgi:pyruvate dehydrogenase E2 component (dihydrolipoamide acetyltransferase)